MRLYLITLGLSAAFISACSSTPDTAATATGTGGNTTSSTTDTGTGGASTSTGMSTGTGGAAAGCGTGAWVTYGHDGQRTSASDGCVDGPLTAIWTYLPEAPAGKVVNRLFHPLASKDAAFLRWSASDPPYTGTSAADRVTLDGKRVWTFDSGTDTDLGDWSSLWKDKLVINSDGIYLLDQADGHGVGSTGVDWWGQTIPTAGALLFSNTSKSDGPGLFVGALDEKAAVVWKQNEQGTMCGQGFADQTGGIALDGATLFYAPLYASGSMTQPMFASGLYAYESTTGMPLWNVPTSPASAVSAGAGLVYLIEGTQGMLKLLARKQADGSVAWTADLAGAGVQAPVLADGKVIVATFSGITAFQQADGKVAWTSMVNVAAFLNNTPVSNGCGGLQPLANLPTTTLAAALGSKTLLAVQGPTATILDLATGKTKWTGTPAMNATLINPIIVGDRVYLVNQSGQPGQGLLAFQSTAMP